MLVSIPLYAAGFALILDMFNLARPWLSRNPQVPDWPWQIIGAIVFIVVLVVVGISIGTFVHSRSWLMVAFGFALIIACLFLVVFTFVGWRKAKLAGEQAAILLTGIEGWERRIHLSSMLIAFLGVMAEIIHRW